MRVGVHAVDVVAVEGKRCPGLDRAFDDHADEILQGDHAAAEAVIADAVKILLFPFLAKAVLQRVALDAQHLMGVKQVPVAADVLFHLLPEIVRKTDRRKNVMGFHPVVAVVGAQLQKLRQIAVPYIKIDSHGALADTELIDRYGCIVGQADPADHAACRAFKAAYVRTVAAHLAKVQPHAAAVLGHIGKVGDAAVNALQVIRDGINKAAGQLMIGLSGIGQGWGGHRDLQRGEHVIEALRPIQALFPGFGNG